MKRVYIVILAIAAFIGLMFYFFFPFLDMKQVKLNISEFAKDAENPSEAVSLEYIILQGVLEIRWNFAGYRAVKKVAQTSGIPVETAIVDAAINQARDYGYIN